MVAVGLGGEAVMVWLMTSYRSGCSGGSSAQALNLFYRSENERRTQFALAK